MATRTIRMADDVHERLKQLARTRKLSINKLMDALSIAALAEFDAETRFRLRAARGTPEAGLRLLDIGSSNSGSLGISAALANLPGTEGRCRRRLSGAVAGFEPGNAGHRKYMPYLRGFST